MNGTCFVLPFAMVKVPGWSPDAGNDPCQKERKYVTSTRRKSFLLIAPGEIEGLLRVCSLGQ